MPPDRSHVGTERRHPHSADFDALGVREAVDAMVEDHAQMLGAVSAASGSLSAFIEALVPRMREGGRLMYVGAGTSGRLGVLDASECPPTFRSDPSQVVGIIAGGDSSLRRSSEGREDEPEGAREELERLAIGPRDTLLGIAAGGTTPYVLGAIRIAHARGAATALLTCAPRDVPPCCDALITVDTGPEIVTGSTRLKAGSATKLALNIITTVAFARLGKVHGNLMVDLAATNDKLVDRALRVMREIAPELSREQAFALLRDAGGHVKVALVMHVHGCGAADARMRIDACGGSLRAAMAR
ncbi:MAG: N-acetylmuramic acid 6-phosphate etherase [Phycisphaerales bacterium]|nr:N-acetylmuramic acid 6-phosphate etherase [Phycisphaerales bacterium]